MGKALELGCFFTSYYEDVTELDFEEFLRYYFVESTDLEDGDKEEFQALDMKAEGGPAIASVSYTGDPDQLDFTQSPRVTVTKTMDTLEEQKHLGGETTVIIKAELGPELPYGHYQLVEWVPSNMRLRKVSRNARDWFSSVR